jgi:hypothetical protein
MTATRKPAQSIPSSSAQTEPEDQGGYYERLNAEQKRSLLLEERAQRAGEITEQARKDYAEAVEEYHEALAMREEQLRERLFKVEDAGALSRAATATDAELDSMLEIAATAGNADLGRAVFLAAEQRGLAEHTLTFLERIDPEARDAYGEWLELPGEEVLERQSENIDLVIPEPDSASLMGYANART